MLNITAAHASFSAWAPAADARHWSDDARCKGQSDVFFDEGTWPWAAVICSRCPVRDECLDDALAHGDLYDFRAGLTPAELRETAKTVLRKGTARVCEWCRMSFVGSARTRYCSKPCRWKASRA